MSWIVDPPEGWRYGFPKKIPDEIAQNPGDKGEKYELWLIDQEYPVGLIGLALKHSRWWQDTDETDGA